MGELFKSWAQNSHNTFDFQAPTGDGTPFGLYGDAGIIKKDARPRIKELGTQHNSPIVNSNYQYIGQSDSYTDFENGVWSYEGYNNGSYTTKRKIVKFENGQIVTVYGIKEIPPPPGASGPGTKMEIFYIGRIVGIYQPTEQNEDGTFDDSSIIVKCLEIKTDTTTPGKRIDNWIIDYVGKSNTNYGGIYDVAYGGDHFNYVQNENGRSKMAISGGWAKYDFPDYSNEYPTDYEENITDGHYSTTITSYYGARFSIFPDDEKHIPWSGISIGVSHLLQTETREIENNPSIETYTSPNEDGTVYNYDYVVYDRQENYTYEQEPVTSYYTFDAIDYDLYKLSIAYDSPDYDPDANFIFLGQYVDQLDYYSTQYNLGSYGTTWVEDESGRHIESFDFRRMSYVATNASEVRQAFPGDFLLRDVGGDDYPGFSVADFQYPYWNQNPIGSGFNDFVTSDKYEYPDPPSFFYFKPTDE